MEDKPRKSITMNIDRLVAVGALVLSLGAVIFGQLNKQNTLEFLTKSDFASFQLQNVQKMSTLESTVNSGFVNISQQISSLQFVPTKEFLDFKEKVTQSQFETRKDVDFVKKDQAALEKQVDGISSSLTEQRARTNLLMDAIVKGDTKK